MKKAFPTVPLSPQVSDLSDGSDQAQEQSIVVPPKLITIADSLQDNELSWFANSQIQPDISIQVEDVNFRIHKYPLVSKCGYIRRLEFQPSISNYEYDFKLENFPGGSETFQIILRFCYGLPVDLTPENVASLRCASEYLEMTEEIEDGNLVVKTETFITFVVLSSWRDTITVLKSCETLSPWTENLQIVRRCCDAIAWKASTGRQPQEDGSTGDEDYLKLDELASLRIDHFMRIITAIRAQGSKPEIIGKCIIHYAERCLPGIDVELEGLRGHGYGKNEITFRVFFQSSERSGFINNGKEQKTIIESLISILPPQLEAIPCKFLLKMLRMAILYSVTPALVSELEKRIALVLEEANVNDLLIPSYRNQVDQAKLMNSPERCTMHDVDTVQRIIEYFLMHEQQQYAQQKSGKHNVSKLLDNYLAAIARDPNLSTTKFQVLAESLPEGARTCHDGLYRAIDTYIKTHPLLPEHDRRRLCKIMNCEKLSLDACMHAAQNDRLPLRTVIQVLFSEQIKMRTAMRAKEPTTQQSGNNSPNNNQSATDAEIKSLRAELENVKAKMAELQSDYAELQQEYEKLSGSKQQRSRRMSGWASSWRKVKNSFHSKREGDVNNGDQGDYGHQRQSPRGQVRRRSSFRRRVSIS
ncbi:hypothetical protein CRG98_020894 [Punica granatum]|uniref:BTB/POZ domain-containing protein DOT3 n=1 Tax=Punica granatum TaxID=22663 RepID=A0A2I0JR13_PUNGR|nr:hypothetical protein CRG98_020894 [Punica granatum]